MIISKPPILFIDAYDSFSNNIISLLETTLNASVRTIKIDNAILATDADLLKELSHYAAVVCGPGPGNPKKEEDVGLMKRIWKLTEEDMLPVLGICLGFQSLCLEFGADVRRLKGPQHGIIRKMSHVGESRPKDQHTIFDGVGDIRATLYQSLCVDIGQDMVSEDLWKANMWRPTKQCPQLLPLAWVESSLSLSDMKDSGVKDDRVLVAVRHQTKPFWALQYHPESICTNDESKKVVINWFSHAQWWNQSFRRKRISFEGSVEGKVSVRESLLSQMLPIRSSQTEEFLAHWNALPYELDGSEIICHSRTLPIPSNLSVPQLLESISNVEHDQILLESTNAYERSIGSANVRGRYSIIGLDAATSMRFEHFTNCKKTRIVIPRRRVSFDIGSGNIWTFLADFLEKRQVLHGEAESPFWGGFMGYTTYELGLETIGVESQNRKVPHPQRPDLCFAWITQSLVIDHVKSVMHLQQLAPRTAEQSGIVKLWMDDIVRKLEIANIKIQSANYYETSHPIMFCPSTISITTPKNAEYESKVLKCQEHIANGDSYELCLTDQTIITRSQTSPTDSWALYKTLRKRQPAPFASYIRLGSATLVSSSPERFLKWDADGNCELRPMKGTVRKSSAVTTLTQATKLLDVPKEKAENLMIVDLVRHDLHGICGSGNVFVPRLMVVEEYASVFQMISIVRGSIPSSYHPSMTNEENQMAKMGRYTGLDVLAASLPPGSMTGAPKKRSCEILQQIESGERGLYSGVVGYLDVKGRGDWSVTIRSAFKWADEDSIGVVGHVGENGAREEKWHVGAGGAVTALSTAIGEREEMETKLGGTLGIFR